MKLSLPALHMGGQYQAYYSKARFKVLICGRRWGKSLLAMIMLITCAVRGGVGWWVWPSFPMAMVGWRKLMAVLRPLIKAKVVEINKQERMIIFPGGGFIQMKSAERANSLRGEGLSLVVIDEWAYIRNGRTVWEADLRPALAEMMGEALLITTPKGMDHCFEYFHKAQKDPLYEAFQCKTESNPYIPRQEIAHAKASMPADIYAQEYDAEFLEGAGSYFMDIERVMKATIQKHPTEGHDYISGLDIGRYRDESVMSICDISLTPAEICWMEVMNNLTFTTQKERVLTVGARYDIDYLCADVTGMGLGLGERIDEEAPFTVVPETYTNSTKMSLFESYHGALENDELLIPNYEWLKVQHQMMVPEIVPGRLSVKIAAREGFMDDGPNSCALTNMARTAPRVTLFARE